MIQSQQKTSLLVPYQLPKFISEDPNYANFSLFIQAYYEWMEEQGNTLDFTKNLINYMDVDTTTDEFLNYFVNDFMSYFPQEILADKTKVIKIAKQLYQTKGTPASFQFLFRVLYNSDVEIFYTKDAVLKASSGKWYVSRSLKLATSDKNFLAINNLRVFGNISKSIATVEAATYDGLKTEVFISNIERLFQSGETVTVVDSNNRPVYFLNEVVVPSGTPGAETLTALIVGQISQVLINPKSRGLLYNVADPVVFYGGLNSNIANPIGAAAQVGSVTTGSIQRITVNSEGYGYTLSDANNIVGGANTKIYFTNLIGNSPQAPIAVVGGLDPIGQANVNLIPVDSIQLKQYHYLGNFAGSSGANTLGLNNLWTQQKYQFANNLTANANTSLANAFTFTAFSTFPMASVIVQNQGGGMSQQPTVGALSLYNTDVYSQTNLANLGILAPIQIINGGLGYSVNDKIVIIGGSGYGAYANVLTVNGAGTIQTVGYVSNTASRYPLGGMGYFNVLPVGVVGRLATGNVKTLLTSNVVTGNGTSFTTQLSNGSILVSNTNIVIGTIQTVINANTIILTSNAAASLNANTFYLSTAQFSFPGILGSGATFAQVSNRVGEITSFNIIDNGEDYISAPVVSLKVQDLIVTNVSPATIVSAGDLLYQGANINTATYIATVDSIYALENFATATDSIYQLRVFNYNSIPLRGQALKVDSKLASMNLVPGYTNIHNTTFDNSANNTRFDSANGSITYGDGQAMANATFLNGLVIGNGQYLDTTGQPSAFDVLQSTEYNNYTYQLTLSKEIAKYRDVLLNLLHPTGMRVLGRIAMSSSNGIAFGVTNALYTGHTLAYYANSSGASATASIVGGTSVNPSNNIVTINNLYGANVGNIFFANASVIAFTYGLGYNDTVKSLVTKVNYASNTVTISDNVWTYIANVAVVAATAGNNYVINIQSLTNSYNTVNNGQYSNTMYPLADIIRVGDSVSVNGVSQTVTYISSTYSTLILGGPLTSGANGYMSVSKTLTSLYGNVQIFGPVGTQYYAELGTETGDILTTEDGTTLLIG